VNGKTIDASEARVGDIIHHAGRYWLAVDVNKTGAVWVRCHENGDRHDKEQQPRWWCATTLTKVGTAN